MGTADGRELGSIDGSAEGAGVAMGEGRADGEKEGSFVGLAEGLRVGVGDGAGVG